MAKKAELEWAGYTALVINQRMEGITKELEQTARTITEFDEITVRQLVSSINVVNENTLIVYFKDGTGIKQIIER